MLLDIFSQHPHWPQVELISQQLHARGHRVVLAGGCVRDALLGQPAADLDIATDATPEQVGSYFEKVLYIGKSFGVCRVVLNSVSLEVATFREESDYLDGRHPEKIVYSTLEKDAHRRDFTVNALFYDLKTHQLIDEVGGVSDLKACRLVTVGDPVQRFREDHLRLLRAARFVAQLGFHLDPQVHRALAQEAPSLQKISRERVQDEIHKAFKSQKPWSFFDILQSSGLMTYVFSDVLLASTVTWQGKSLNVIHILREFFQESVSSPALGWALLNWLRIKTGVEISRGEEWLHHYKLSSEIIQVVADIISAEDLTAHQDPLAVFLKSYKKNHNQQIYIFWKKISDLFEHRAWTESWTQYSQKYLVQGELPEPKVTGKDLLAQGFAADPKMKSLLEKSYREQLESPNLSKDELINKLKN